jgi:hypothetical protein
MDWPTGICVKCATRPQMKESVMCGNCFDARYKLQHATPRPQPTPTRVVTPCAGCGMIDEHALECRTRKMESTVVLRAAWPEPVLLPPVPDSRALSFDIEWSCLAGAQ